MCEQAIEDSRKEMTQKWVRMTATSPFHTDYLDREDKRIERQKISEKNREHEKFVKTTLKNMTGKPDYEICPMETIQDKFSNVHDGIKSLSLQLRLHNRSKITTYKEKDFCEKLITDEVEKLYKKFPGVIEKEKCEDFVKFRKIK